MVGAGKVTVVIPSRLGSEKIAMEKAAEVARKMGFSDDRVSDLKTAVAEACINAMEHGNRFDSSTSLGVTLTTGPSALEVAVRDEGEGISDVSVPSMEAKVEGQDESKRGWGIFLIDNLMDEVHYESSDGGGSVVRMIIHLEKQDLSP
jgi:serine/threonine-protein kinase RsbW